VDESSERRVELVVLATGVRAVLKTGMPHMESMHELHGLRFWNGDPTVRLLQADETQNAMLIEACEPGTPLGDRPEPEQDVVIAQLLRRAWRRPADPHPFRPLATMLRYWADEKRTTEETWSDRGLVQEGLRLFDALSHPTSDDVLLHTDLHAGNVLSSQREPWLAIDPKPFIGDPAYDATQHLLNCVHRLRADPHGMIHRMSDLLEVDRDRLRLWTLARLAAAPSGAWDAESANIATRLARA